MAYKACAWARLRAEKAGSNCSGIRTPTKLSSIASEGAAALRCPTTFGCIGLSGFPMTATLASCGDKQYPDTPRRCRLLRIGAAGESEQTEEGDQHNERESAAAHRITSSARSRIDCGMAMPSDLAAFRLTTKSNFVGCSIGRSPGLAPLRILST